MSRRRQERMAVEMKRVMSTVIKDEMKDPRIDFSKVSITRVDVSNDLSHARVYISVLGDEADQEETIKALQKAKGFLRSEIAGLLNIRHAPELDLRLDRSIEHGIHISSLLEEIKKETPPGSDGDLGHE